jgi:hypothetical protein
VQYAPAQQLSLSQPTLGVTSGTLQPRHLCHRAVRPNISTTAPPVSPSTLCAPRERGNCRAGRLDFFRRLIMGAMRWDLNLHASDLSEVNHCFAKRHRRNKVGMEFSLRLVARVRLLWWSCFRTANGVHSSPSLRVYSSAYEGPGGIVFCWFNHALEFSVQPSVLRPLECF